MSSSFDVAVFGGGIARLWNAFHLAERGLRVGVLIDPDHLSDRATEHRQLAMKHLQRHCDESVGYASARGPLGRRLYARRILGACFGTYQAAAQCARYRLR
jgi:glycine/D-amino acid oxidase-like deaminating enzyme